MDSDKKPKMPKKITKVRLKNIALYYLERFETSVQNLKDVLRRRIDKYAFQVPEFDKNQAYFWIDEIIEEFEALNYVSDERYAALKVKDYLNAGKSARYIKMKLKSKGVNENTTDALIEGEDYDASQSARRLAQKKHIGPYRLNDEDRKENLKKDMGTLLRAGFDYDTVCDILKANFEE